MDLNKKKILLTGGTSGIGKAILQELIKYDVKILVASLDVNNLDIKDEKIIPYECNMEKLEQIEDMFDFAIKKMGNIDIVFANAGFAYYEEIKEPDYQRIERIYKVNVFAPIYICEKMYKLYPEKDYRVVITASAMAKLALPGYSLYSSTKAAIHSFITAYRYENNSRNKMIVVYPIATKTEFFKAANKGTPIPFPAQTAEYVAKKIVSGVRKNKKSINPSILFNICTFIDRVLPFTLKVYAYVQYKIFRKYLNK